MFGKTRQGYYKMIDHIERTALDEQIILQVVRSIRKKVQTDRWGVRKLHGLVNEELQDLNFRISRDKLFDLLRKNNMLVRKRKRKFFTTQSHHWLRKYDNLIISRSLTATDQLWVSDITYIKPVEGDPFYLYLITDAYSQKILGWHLGEDLKADSALFALNMALKRRKGTLTDLIHHSDRGVQYCSSKYVRKLDENDIKISMTNPGSPHENAIAERVNGILKEEWLNDLKLRTLRAGRRKMKEIIDIYNTIRPHESLNYKTPEQIHDTGFSRHETERVIGEMYKYEKKASTKKVDT